MKLALATRLVTWLLPICLISPGGGSEHQLDPRIGPAVPAKFTGIRDAKDWLNPYLSVCPQGVVMRVRSITRERRTIPIADLGRTLLELPVDAWPYGRVVGLQPCGLGHPGDELQQAKRYLDVKAVLNSLRLWIYEVAP